MKRLLGIGLVLCFWIGSLWAQETTLVIYSTNDMHGNLYPFAKIAKYLKSEKAKHPHTLVVSGGDMFTGNPIVDQYPLRGFPMIEVMNQTGYQFAVLGNHEFDYGQKVLSECIQKANFEMICANVKADSAIIDQPKPYTFTEIDGIRICILGLVETTKKFQGAAIPSVHPERLKGLSFTSPLETALQYKHLRQECDLFVGLFHTGYETDKEIAKAMPELDVIIGGHSHTRIPSSRLTNGVLITQANEHLKYIGKTTLTLKDKKVINKEFQLINVDSLTEEDSLIKQEIQRFYNEIPLEKVLAQAKAQFDGRQQLGALMTDAIVDIYHTDFAFQNSGGVRISMLPKGNITLADIYRLDPFGNSIIVYEMKPSDIRTLLRNSYQKGSKSIDLIPSGLRYAIHVSNNQITSIVLTDEEGRPLEENKTYKVGMNSYIAYSYHFDKTLPHEEMPIKATDGLIKYLEQEKEIVPFRLHRGVIVDE